MNRKMYIFVLLLLSSMYRLQSSGIRSLSYNKYGQYILYLSLLYLLFDLVEPYLQQLFVHSDEKKNSGCRFQIETLSQ